MNLQLNLVQVSRPVGHRPSSRRQLLGPLALCLLASAAHAEGPAASATGEAGWSRWQGRIGLNGPQANAAPQTPTSGLQGGSNGGNSSNLSLLGDYYFTQSGLSPQDQFGGGFRATGGLFVGPRSGLWLATPASFSALSSGWSSQRRNFGLLPGSGPEAVDSGSVPYVGVGYTGLKSLRATGGGWGFSADVGLMALQPRSLVRLGAQSLSDGARDMQLSPLLQVGVSYSF